jgi:hypothetical protein
MQTRRLMAAGLALSASLCSGVVRADEASSKRAQQLFDEAFALLDAGKPAEACPKFRESLATEASVGALLNVADCEKTDGNLVKAAEAYRSALGMNSSTSDPERRKAIEEQAARELSSIEGKLGRLRVRVTPESAKASVSVDGAAVVIDAPNEIIAGSHTLTIRAEGFRDETRTLDVVARKEADVKVVLTPIKKAEPPLVPVAPEADSLVVPAIIVGVVGVAGLAVGGGLIAAAAGKADEISALCGPDAAPPSCPNGDPTAANALSSEGETLATGAYIAFGLGGAALATSVTLIIVDASASATPKPEMKVKANMSPGAAGLSLEGTF